jgi:hypothetical protein
LIRKISGYPGDPSGAAFIAHLPVRRIRVEADTVDQLFNSSEKQLARPAPALGELQRGRDSRADERENRQRDASLNVVQHYQLQIKSQT